MHIGRGLFYSLWCGLSGYMFHSFVKECKFCCCWGDCSINVDSVLLVDGVELFLYSCWFSMSLFYQLLREGCWSLNYSFFYRLYYRLETIIYSYIIDFSVSSFNFSGFCFRYFVALLFTYPGVPCLTDGLTLLPFCHVTLCLW